MTGVDDTQQLAPNWARGQGRLTSRGLTDLSPLVRPIDLASETARTLAPRITWVTTVVGFRDRPPVEAMVSGQGVLRAQQVSSIRVGRLGRAGDFERLSSKARVAESLFLPPADLCSDIAKASLAGQSGRAVAGS